MKKRNSLFTCYLLLFYVVLLISETRGSVDLAKCVLHFSQIHRPLNLVLRNEKCSYITLSTTKECALENSKDIKLRSYYVALLRGTPGGEVEGMLWHSLAKIANPTITIRETRKRRCDGSAYRREMMEKRRREESSSQMGTSNDNIFNSRLYEISDNDECDANPVAIQVSKTDMSFIQQSVLEKTIQQSVLERSTVDLTKGVRIQLTGLYYVMKDARVFVRLNALRNVYREYRHLADQLQREDFLASEAELLFNSTFNKISSVDHTNSFDENLIQPSTTYNESYGFLCSDPTKPSIAKQCDQSFLNGLFTSPTAKNPVHSHHAVFKLTGSQKAHGTSSIINVLKKKPNLIKLRFPNEIEEDLTDSLKTSIAEMKKQGTRDATNKVSYADELKKFLDEMTDYKVDTINNVVLLKQYFSIQWTTHQEFKRSHQSSIIDSASIQLPKDDGDKLRFYSLHPEIIADAASCEHVIDNNRYVECSWARSSKSMSYDRNFPFYISNNKMDYEKRMEAFEFSLSFLSSLLKNPTLRVQYETFLRQLKNRIDHMSLSLTKTNPFLLKFKSNKDLRKVPGSLLFQALLNETTFFGISDDVAALFRAHLVVPTSTSSVERAFSTINKFKDHVKTKMQLPMMNARLRVVTNAPDLNLYDPSRAARIFLKHEPGRGGTLPVAFTNSKNVMWEANNEAHLPFSSRQLLLFGGDGDYRYSKQGDDPVNQPAWARKLSAIRNL